MGKSKGRAHNKLYITPKEYLQEGYGGKAEREKVVLQRPLPFDCCALTLTPFEDPVCTPDGTVYDILSIVQWLKKYKLDPATGKPLSPKELIPLKFHKNAEGKYHCPLSYKEFSDHSHLVAVRPTGHVYLYETIKKLCLEKKSLKDPITGEDFTKQDLIVLQDPNNLEKRTASHFWFIREGVTLKPTSDNPLDNMQVSSLTKKVLEQYEAEKEKEKLTEPQEKLDAIASMMADPKAPNDYLTADSGSFTATSFVPGKKAAFNDRIEAKKTTKKGYVSMTTSLGDLNFEIHCDLVPKASENFITHCQDGFYTNTIFHRLIKSFMVQGGDPTGTGHGGKSIWERKFEDEFHPNLKHDVRGVLSMANSGPNTNGSQFFVTFKPTKHLDGKHSVFGKLVGGMDVLNKIEQITTDSNDKPVSEIRILHTVVHVNPFSEEEQAKDAAEKKKKEREEAEKNEIGRWYSNPSGLPSTSSSSTSTSGVGKYLNASNPDAQNTKKRTLDFGAVSSSAKRQKSSENYGNFSGF